MTHSARFVRAYNAGNVQGTFDQFSRTEALGFSDCDYARQQPVDGHGRAQLTAWLPRNFEQHDRLILGDITGPNPDQPLGVLGVSFSRRNSDAIASAGHPNGITPTIAAKVKFDNSGQITEFNNGPVGGPAASCRIG